MRRKAAEIDPAAPVGEPGEALRAKLGLQADLASLLDLVAPQHVEGFKKLLKSLSKGEAPPPRHPQPRPSSTKAHHPPARPAIGCDLLTPQPLPRQIGVGGMNGAGKAHRHFGQGHAGIGNLPQIAQRLPQLQQRLSRERPVRLARKRVQITARRTFGVVYARQRILSP